LAFDLSQHLLSLLLNKTAKENLPSIVSYAILALNSLISFVQLDLPKKAIEKAESLGQCADVFYAFQLLENTGICIVPGSGFGQQAGTFHFRSVLLSSS
jgi:aspartate/methionine/tyrosine aminotransferase